MMLNIRHLPYLLAPLVFALASGCAALSTKPGRVEITSDPAGAEVYVMGNNVGLTPLTLDEHAIFPPTYPMEKQALYGSVVLHKAGCNSVSERISTRAMKRGLHIKLDCGLAARGQTSMRDQAQSPAPVTGQAQTTAVVQGKPSIELRLKQVQDLRDKGLITEQEAHEIRQRILGEL